MQKILKLSRRENKYYIEAVSGDAHKTAKEMTQQFKYGDFYAGRGVDGYGTYLV